MLAVKQGSERKFLIPLWAEKNPPAILAVCMYG